MYFDCEAREAKPYMSGVMGYELSADKTKLLTMRRRGVCITSAKGAPSPDEQVAICIQFDEGYIQNDGVFN